MRWIVLTLSLVLLAGCIDITVEQTLHRNGHVDLVLVYEADTDDLHTSLQREAESGSIQKIFEEGYAEAGLEPPKMSVERTDRGARLIIEDLDVQNMPASLKDSTYTSFGWEREFKFPFYYYKYTVENPLAQSLTGDSFTGLTADVLDLYFVVKPFGTITATNGERISQDAVRFDLLDAGTYQVSFRDFFLFSWLGGAQTIEPRDAVALSQSPFGLTEEDSAFAN